MSANLDRTMPEAPIAIRRSNTLADMSATEYLARFRAGEVTAFEYASAFADRIEALDGQIKAFHCWDKSRFLERAKGIDQQWRDGKRTFWMPGVPVGVKDVFNTYDFPTGMGSAILDKYTPGNDARVVSNIRLEGGLVPGKTVTAEFAVHHPGATVNPHDYKRTPGTSSSGSAAAVAARFVPLALGTQTAGSVMRPASYCGVIGWKPSFGLLPRTAMLKTTDSLDTVGVFGRTVHDVELLFEVCRVRGRNYPVSDAALSDTAHQTPAKPGKWRVGLMRGPKSSYQSSVVSRELGRLAQKLQAAGMEIVDYDLPAAFNDAHDIHERIYRRALAYYFKLEWAQRPDMFSPVLAEMISDGLTNITPADYHEGVRRQTELAALFDAGIAARGLDALICPTTADEAPIGLDARDLPDHCLIFTMVGASAMTLPLLSGTSGLPVGLQVVTRKYADYKLLSLAREIVQVGGSQ